jgi:SNF2 family DNA or RNA helicase
MTTPTTTETYNRFGVPQTLHTAIRILAAEDPDRASVRNARGFNGRDGEFGHAMSEKAFEDLTPNMAHAMRKVVTTYRAQLARHGVDVDAIDMSKVGQPQPRAERPKKVATISLVDGALHFTSEQDDPNVSAVRALPRRRWLGAPTWAWDIALIRENVDGLRGLYRAGVTFTPQALAALKNLTGGPNGGGHKGGSNAPTLGGRTLVQWQELAADLAEARGSDRNDALLEEALERIRELKQTRGGSNAPTTPLRDLATAKQGTLEVKGLGMQLFPFQRAAVEYMLRTKRCLNASEMGTGKSGMALAALQAAGAFPALIVCPATLKLNWRAEVAKWLPGRTVTVLSGTKPEAFLHGDIVVINWDILRSWQELLSTTPWKALVCDEVHMAKDRKALRSQALKALIRATAPEYRFFLTGTPLLNRPVEITNSLDMLGYLRPVFGGWKRFVDRYCAATETRFGLNVSGANMALLPELNERLRSTCMVRHLKKDVLLELPAKTRADVPVEMDAKVLAQYRRAESDIIDWLCETEGSGKASIAMRAEQLVRINTLRQLAAKGKLKAIISWADNFTGYDRKTGEWDDNGDKLVLFAHFREVQDALQKAFPNAAYIRSDQSKESVEEHKTRFQTDPKCKLIICSLKAGGLGHTLTAASQVALAELDWTPAAISQATDRVHRIGQRDAVTAWYLLADETIDNYMARLIHQKEEVIDAAVDGKLPGSVDEESVLDAVVQHLRSKRTRN